MNIDKKNCGRVLSRQSFRELVGISRTTEWRLEQEGRLPAKVVIGGRCLGYSYLDYERWLTENSVVGGGEGV